MSDKNFLVRKWMIALMALTICIPACNRTSGGALINAAGELVGINSQILSPTRGNIGIGFAIPVNMAKNVSALPSAS